MTCKSLLSALVMLAPFAGPASAQEWNAQPMEIDAGDDAGDSVLVVVAYQPDTTTAPQIFGASGAGRAAVLSDDGKPVPSIILGRIDAGQEAQFGITTLLPQTVEEIGLTHDDVAARVAFKQAKPEIYRQLVSEGHIDPPDERALKVALQSELKRMNCYRSGIDGAWGPGSRRSVSSYFGKRSAAQWPDQEPTVGLFREIILSDDVRCEAPVAVAAPRTAAKRTTTTRSTRTTRATTTRTTKKKPVVRTKPRTTAAKKPKISLDVGIGSLR